MAQESSIKSRGPIAAHPVISAVITILTVAVVFFAVYVPLFASATPKVGDFPFFYFYLLIYMPVVAIVCWIILLLRNRLTPPAGGPDGPAASTGLGEVAK
jgi:hypothetical protein